MGNKKMVVLLIICGVFIVACKNNKSSVKTSVESMTSSVKNKRVTTKSGEKNTVEYGFLIGDWVSSQNDVIRVKENKQKIEVESRYMIGGEMSFINYDQQNNSYTFENNEESISFQILTEKEANIWYGKLDDQTTGTAAPIVYTKKDSD